MKPGSHITLMVPAVVPAALPGTCPRQIFFLMGALAPGAAVPAVKGRVELSSTFQATPVPKADEKFDGNTYPRYRRLAAGKLFIC